MLSTQSARLELLSLMLIPLLQPREASWQQVASSSRSLPGDDREEPCGQLLPSPPHGVLPGFPPGHLSRPTPLAQSSLPGARPGQPSVWPRWPCFPGRQIIFWDLRASECERHQIKASTQASFKQKKALPHEVEDTLSLPALHTVYQLFSLNLLSLAAALQDITLPPPGRSRSSPGSISSVWWVLGGVLISSKNNDTGYLSVSDRNSSGHLRSP